MAWFTDIKSSQEMVEFIQFMNSEKATFGYQPDDSGGGGRGEHKSLGNLLGAWGCTYAIEGQPCPNPHILYTFNVWKTHRQAERNILLAEFVMGFCRKGPLAGKGAETARFVKANPMLLDRTYPNYKLALENAAKAGVLMATVWREVVDLRDDIQRLFEAPWNRFQEARMQQFMSERANMSSLGNDPSIGLKKLRQKQKSKLEGKVGGLFGSSEQGQFLLIHEAKDGAPLLLLSTGYGTPISERHEKEARMLMSGKGDKMSKGYWKQSGNHKTITFAVTAEKGGGLSTVSLFRLALAKMDVSRTVIASSVEDMKI